jgi:hypothetical protein
MPFHVRLPSDVFAGGAAGVAAGGVAGGAVAVCACATPAAANEAVNRTARIGVIFGFPVFLESRRSAANIVTSKG